jgi:hypothetical protein
MRLVEIKDLEVGDEILISCQSCFKYLRVLKKPVIGTRIHWSTQQPCYKSVKCSTKRVDKVITWVRNSKTYSRTVKEWEFTPEDHNVTIFVNLTDKQILLVNKDNLII